MSKHWTSRGNVNWLCSPNLITIKRTLRFIQSLSQSTYIDVNTVAPQAKLSPVSVIWLFSNLLRSRQKAIWLCSANKHVLTLSTEANRLCSPNLIIINPAIRIMQSLSQPTYICVNRVRFWAKSLPIFVILLSCKYLRSRRNTNWLYSANKHVLSLSTEAKLYYPSS